MPRAGLRVKAFSCGISPSSLFLSPVHRCSGPSGGGHAAQLHGAGGDNLGDTRRDYPVCQTDLCGDAGGTVCNKAGKVHTENHPSWPHESAGSRGACLSRPLHHAWSDHSHCLVPPLETHPVSVPRHCPLFLESHTGSLSGRVPRRRWFVSEQGVASGHRGASRLGQPGLVSQQHPGCRGKEMGAAAAAPSTSSPLHRGHSAPRGPQPGGGGG